MMHVAATHADGGSVALGGDDELRPDHLLSLRRVGQIFGAGEKRYHALHNIDLDVPRSEFLCLLGPCGLREIDAPEHYGWICARKFGFDQICQP